MTFVPTMLPTLWKRECRSASRVSSYLTFDTEEPTLRTNGWLSRRHSVKMLPPVMSQVGSVLTVQVARSGTVHESVLPAPDRTS